MFLIGFNLLVLSLYSEYECVSQCVSGYTSMKQEVSMLMKGMHANHRKACESIEINDIALIHPFPPHVSLLHVTWSKELH